MTFLFIPWRGKAGSVLKLALIALCASVLIWSITLTVASAHSTLVQSEPTAGEALDESPGQVVAWFSEELDSSQSGLRVFNIEEKQVDNGDGRVDLVDLEHKSMTVSLPAVLPDGKYTVRWIAASAEDGDATQGEFTFDVGSVAPADEPASGGSSTSVWLIGGAALVVIFAILVIINGRRPKDPVD